MALTSGTYVPKNEKTVTHWAKPDKDGDGPVVWVQEKDAMGNHLGRSEQKDALGNTVHEYLPPEGFTNLRGYDGTDNYVRLDDRQQPLRAPNGHAIGIKPGTTLIEYPDGSFDLLEDDFSRYLFEQAHEKVG